MVANTIQNPTPVMGCNSLIKWWLTQIQAFGKVPPQFASMCPHPPPEMTFPAGFPAGHHRRCLGTRQRTDIGRCWIEPAPDGDGGTLNRAADSLVPAFWPRTGLVVRGQTETRLRSQGLDVVMRRLQATQGRRSAESESSLSMSSI